MKPRILLLDIETSYCKTANFTLRVYGHISPSNILEDWSIYCAAWKFLDEKKIHSACVKPRNIKNDKQVVKKLRKAVVEADLIVGHNLDKFDLKRLNTRLIYHNLPPIDHAILTVDTLKLAKKHFYFTSNRLDYLARFFKIGCKMKHNDGDPWLKLVRHQDVAKTLEHMETYCKSDVSPLLEQVYLKLRPYSNHPKFESEPGELLCQHCGGKYLHSRGTKLTRGGHRYAQYQCQNRECMGWTFGKLRKDAA